MNLKKTISITSIVLAAALCVTPALAVDEHNVVSGLTAVGAPLGLHGIDPVAFIDIGNRSPGSATHVATHEGVAYYFASGKNMLTFKQKPDLYVPQNGGFCTFGASVGKKFDGNPNYASVVEGKLYVFLNEEILNLYLADQSGTISRAAAKWQKIEHIAATEL